ncbi:MAG: DUF4115 domain-containing protein [Cardiobacteriaceae bacterium]|nr:DUF4115 domain-containing protein [Cardiobacteriaceae bacterium]
MSEKTTTSGNLDIGAVLSAARMKRDLSIPTAAMQSSLSQDIIEKLEQNRFAEIAAPVFTRGYLSLYARFLGLNEAAVSQAFNRIRNEPQPELRLSAANVESQTKAYRRSYLGLWLLIFSVLVVGGVLLYQLIDNNSWLMKQINGAFNAPSTSETLAGTENTTPSEKSQDIVLEIGGQTVGAENVQPVADSVATSPVDAASVPGITNQDTQNTAEAGATENEKPAPTGDQRGIQLSFSAESWVQIQDSSRKSVVSRIIKAGEKVELPAEGAPYSFNIGRPDGVVMVINGQEQPLDNYRQKGSGRRFTVEVPNG